MATDAAPVRDYLLRQGFTTDGVLARVGSAAFAALGRGLAVPTRRALSGSSGALEHLIELFLLAEAVPSDSFPSDVTTDLGTLGLVRRSGSSLVPLVEVHPYGEVDTDWYLVNDIGQPQAPDHVLGLGGASLTLARITPRGDVGRVLDLGCGSGVQALHAARHCARVVATDLNPRALELTALTLALSGIPADQTDLRQGELFEPVSDEQFDLIVSNPPFVISPAHRFTYRDAGRPGDELSRDVVRGAAQQLAPGGTAVVLANWMHVTDQHWRDRVDGWLAQTGVDAWVVQRDTQSVADYAATWLRDAQVPEGADFDRGMDEWLDAFAAAGCSHIGFGWVVLVAAPSVGQPPWFMAEDLSHGHRLPDGAEVAGYVDASVRVEQLTAPQLLATDARLAVGATVTTTAQVAGTGPLQPPPRLGLAGSVGDGGWRPSVPVIPELLRALLAEADTTIGQRLDAAAAAADLDPLDILGPALTGLRELVRMGIVRTD